MGRGKARAPYEFGCQVSIFAPVTAPNGGRFVLHAKALHSNLYDGHTLGLVIADLEKLAGLPSAASTATRAIAVTTIGAESRSVSAASSGMPPRPLAARCDAELPSSP